MITSNNNNNNNMAMMATTTTPSITATSSSGISEEVRNDSAEINGVVVSSDIVDPDVADSNNDDDDDDDDVDVPPDWIRPLLHSMNKGNSHSVNNDDIVCNSVTDAIITATIRRFDDGHIPERLVNSQKEHPTRIVEYVQKFGATSSDVPDGSSDISSSTTAAASAACDENTRQCFVYSDAFPQFIVNELYHRTCNNCNNEDANKDGYSKSYPAWGTYVTCQQIEQYWKTKQQQQQQEEYRRNDSQDDKEQQQHDSTIKVETDMLYVETAARYLEYAMRSSNSQSSPPTLTHYKYNISDKTMTTATRQIGHPPDTDPEEIHDDDDDDALDPNPLFSSDDMSFIHGVALWGLRADVGSQVPYHLDYAEQIRYTTNVIVPPVLAGTLQCTSQQINGGSFQLSMEGISHYEQHGYKCKLSPLEIRSPKRKGDEGQNHKYSDNVETNQDDSDDKMTMKNKRTNRSDRHSGIVDIPYKYNQLIVHSGDLPHWSTKIESIGDGDDDDDDGGGGGGDSDTATKPYRVIVGFNVFPGGGVGERVQAAPEHSKAFRQLVSSRKNHHKSLDLLSGQPQPLQENMKKQKKQLLSVADLCRNKPLGRLLVKAKREQDRKNFKLGQEWLEQQLPTYLPANVQDLVKLFSGSLDGNKTDENIEENNNKRQAIPRLHPDDVRVFITHKLRDGTFRVIDSSSDSNILSKGLVSMRTEIALAT